MSHRNASAGQQLFENGFELGLSAIFIKVEYCHFRTPSPARISSFVKELMP